MVESSESKFIRNFRPYCDYFLSELSNSGVVRAVTHQVFCIILVALQSKVPLTISHQNFRIVMRRKTCQIFWTVLVAPWPKVPNLNLFLTFDYRATISLYRNFQPVVRPLGVKIIIFEFEYNWRRFFKNQMVKTSNSFIFWNIKQKSFLLAIKTWNWLLSMIHNF